MTQITAEAILRQLEIRNAYLKLRRLQGSLTYLNNKKSMYTTLLLDKDHEDNTEEALEKISKCNIEATELRNQIQNHIEKYNL